jgi:WD40 repeat protein
MRTLGIKRGNFAAVVYTPDGRTLISLHSRRQVRFWDLATFAERLGSTVPGGSHGAGRLMLAGDLLIVNAEAWEAAEILERLKGPPGGKRRVWLTPLALQQQGVWGTLTATPDGRRLAGLWWGYVAGRNYWVARLRVWDRNGRLLKEHDLGEGPRRSGTALSPDGRTFVACHRTGVCLYDPESGAECGRFVPTDTPQETLFSPDGRLLAVGAGRSVWLWDVARRQALTRFPAFRRYCDSLAFHPGRPVLAAGGRDGEVRLFDTQGLREIARYDWEIGAVHGLAFAPDGATAAAAGHNNALVVWDVDV